MASGYESSIVFFTEKGVKSDEHFRDVSTMEDGSIHYTQCEVTKLSGKGAVWLVYSEKNYGRGGFGEGKACIVLPFSSGKINPGFRIRSAQAFNVTDPCMCLFEHTNYRGNKLATSQGVEDTRPEFPPNPVTGAHSCIAMSGNWQLCTKPAYNGGRQEVDATGVMREVSSFPDLDHVESVKLLRAS